jgi:Zn-dependent protease
MILTVGTYSAFYGLPYATGMVGLILVHESGHALVMRHLGIPFSPMVFIPFVGASVAMERNPHDAYEEALVALGGPVLGSMGALAVAGMAHLNDSQLLFALADFGFMINLFNLMPLGMMDGGRICGAISPYSGLIGLGMGGSLIWYGHITNPIFYLIMIAGGYQTVMRLWKPDESLPRNYYRLSTRQKGVVAGAYFGLVGSLIAAMAINERYKKSPEQLMYERERKQLSLFR